jgi:hypothetical protein
LWPTVLVDLRTSTATSGLATHVIEIQKRLLAEGLAISDQTLRQRVHNNLIWFHGKPSRHAKRVRIDLMQFTPAERQSILKKAAVDTSGDGTEKSQVGDGKPKFRPTH